MFASLQSNAYISAQKHQKRHREGYDTDSQILSTETSILEFIENEDSFFILTEYCNGGSLKDVIMKLVVRKESMSLITILKIFCQIYLTFVK